MMRLISPEEMEFNSYLEELQRKLERGELQGKDPFPEDAPPTPDEPGEEDTTGEEEENSETGAESGAKMSISDGYLR